jgi:hypothetical protein
VTLPKPIPIACSLDPAEMAERGEEMRALARRALVGRTRDAGALRLEFENSDGTAEAVHELVRRERECCPFLGFTLDGDRDRLIVRIAAPSGAETVLDAIYEQNVPRAETAARPASAA